MEKIVNQIIVNPTSEEVISQHLAEYEDFFEILRALNSESDLVKALHSTFLANNAAKKGDLVTQTEELEKINNAEFMKAAEAYLSQSAECRNYYLNNGVGRCPKTPTFDVIDDNNNEVISIYLSEAYKPAKDEEASLF